jgi:uncharacterized protein YcfJ
MVNKMKSLKTLAVVTLLSLGGCASNPYDTVKVDVVGSVIASEKAPMICKKKSKNKLARILVGGLVGGAIGNQIGGGNGRDAAKIIGIGTGMAVGNSSSKTNKHVCKKDGYHNTVAFTNPQTKQYDTRVLKTDRRLPLKAKVIVAYKYKVYHQEG